MKRISFLAVLAFLLAISVQSATGQADSDSTIWVIRTYDGNEFFGTILEENEVELRLQTENLGVLTIAIKDIRSRKEVRPQAIVEGDLWLENSQAARYFWAPNGYGLRKGEGYYQNVWVLFNQVSYGFTNNFSVGIGMVPLFLIAGGPTPIWVTPKVSFPIKEDVFNVGAGALVGTILGENPATFGIAYGVTTFGSRDKNINLGLGYGFADGDWADRPTITLSGMVRTGKRGYLVSENYLITTGQETIGLLSLGGRVVWTGISVDFAAVLPVADIGEFIVLPWLGFVVPFGN
jgi:hypothetical protein